MKSLRINCQLFLYHTNIVVFKISLRNSVVLVVYLLFLIIYFFI